MLGIILKSNNIIGDYVTKSCNKKKLVALSCIYRYSKPQTTALDNVASI